jgi:hypothetical protein
MSSRSAKKAKQLRLELYLEANGKCHYCGCHTIFPRGNLLNNVPNVATIDHLVTRFDADRSIRCSNKIRRHVLSCYSCNQLRGRLVEITFFASNSSSGSKQYVFVLENNKVRLRRKEESVKEVSNLKGC